MKQSNQRHVSLLLFILLFFAGYLTYSANGFPPTSVTQAAREGMAEFAALQSNSRLDMSHPYSLSAATLDHGFRIYTISPQAMVKSTDLSVGITPMAAWRFIIKAEGRPVSMITVAPIQGQWRAVSIGGEQLAGELNGILQKWPPKKGYNYRFVRIFQAQADFVEISHDGSIKGFVPLTASRAALGMEGEFDPGVVLKNSQIFPRLKDRVLEKLGRATIN